MICPNCSATVESGEDHCLSCGIVISKWKVRESQRMVQELRKNRPKKGGRSGGGLSTLVNVKLLAALAVFGYILSWWPKVMVTAPLPVEPGSYENKLHHFAMVPPAGWLRYDPSGWKELIEVRRLPTTANDFLGLAPKGPLLDGWLNPASSDRFLPVFQVQAVSNALDLWYERSPGVPLFAAGASFMGFLRDVVETTRGLRRVDRLGAVQLEGTANLVVDTTRREAIETDRFAKGGRFKEVPVRWFQVMLPGNERTYLLTGFSMEGSWEENRAAFLAAVDTFRVLDERPPPYGPLVTAVVRVGMVMLIMISGVFVLSARR